MKDAELIRSLIGLRSADRPPDDVIARLGKAELASQPEATIVAIVRGWNEFRSNGYAEADIYREIEGRREQAYGQEPLPADLTLDTYTRYRLKLEYPSQAALHDPVFVMQAVHRVRAALETEYGPEGMPVTLRTMLWVDMAILVHAALVAVIQGVGNALHVTSGPHSLDVSAEIWLLMVVAAAVVVGAFGFAGKAAWGRTVLMAAWLAEIVVPWGLIASSAPGDMARSEVPVAIQAVNTLILLAFLAYVRRHNAGRAVAT